MFILNGCQGDRERSGRGVECEVAGLGGGHNIYIG